VQATVVNDMKTFDATAIGNRLTVGDAAFGNFRKKMTQPIAAMSALKRAAHANGDVTNGFQSIS
jgi:hypothetical protein